MKRRSHPMREAAVAAMMRGQVTPHDVAEALGVSRQLVHYWCRAAGMARVQAETRRAYVKALLSRARKTPGRKARMRKAADKAKAAWESRNVERS